MPDSLQLSAIPRPFPPNIISADPIYRQEKARYLEHLHKRKHIVLASEPGSGKRDIIEFTKMYVSGKDYEKQSGCQAIAIEPSESELRTLRTSPADWIERCRASNGDRVVFVIIDEAIKPIPPRPCLWLEAIKPSEKRSPKPDVDPGRTVQSLEIATNKGVFFVLIDSKFCGLKKSMASEQVMEPKVISARLNRPLGGEFLIGSADRPVIVTAN